MKEKSELHFPMVIAITALVLSLISGVVNYRQNNLSNLESSLRDTRDQLQLAKSDIADIRMQTVQKLVDAELAYKAQERLEDEKNSLRLDLADAHDRIAELEALVKKLDRTLTQKKQTPEARSKKTTARKPAIKTDSDSGTIPTKVSHPEASAATADVDFYTVNVSAALQQQVAEAVAKKGFTAKFPEKSKTMSMTDTTTVFYYDESYMIVARALTGALADISGSPVRLRKGASPFNRNKIIVHIIGN